MLPGFVLVVSRGYSLVAMHRLLFAVASLVGELGLEGARASVVAALGLQSTDSIVMVQDLVALKHVGSSQIRDGTSVSCIGKQILYH